jgi:beta-galactosidase
LVLDVYKGLRRLGLNIDILPPDTADLSAYDLVLAPSLATIPAPLMQAFAVHQSIALLGPRTDAKTAEFATPVPLPPALPGMAAVVARVESLPSGLTVPLANGGHFLRWRVKLEGGSAREMTSDGWPALIAAGRLHYLAGWPDEAALARILTGLCANAGIEVEALPEALRKRPHGHCAYYFNYSAAPVAFRGATVSAADFAIFPA